MEHLLGAWRYTYEGFYRLLLHNAAEQKLVQLLWSDGCLDWFRTHLTARAQLSSFEMCLMLIMTKHDAQVVPVGVNMMHCNSQFVAQYSHPTNLKESLHDSWHTNMRNQKTWKSWRRRWTARMNDNILECARLWRVYLNAKKRKLRIEGRICGVVERKNYGKYWLASLRATAFSVICVSVSVSVCLSVCLSALFCLLTPLVALPVVALSTDIGNLLPDEKPRFCLVLRAVVMMMYSMRWRWRSTAEVRRL
jgi:hypothetical protein